MTVSAGSNAATLDCVNHPSSQLTRYQTTEYKYEVHSYLVCLETADTCTYLPRRPKASDTNKNKYTSGFSTEAKPERKQLLHVGATHLLTLYVLPHIRLVHERHNKRSVNTKNPQYFPKTSRVPSDYVSLITLSVPTSKFTDVYSETSTMQYNPV